MPILEVQIVGALSVLPEVSVARRLADAAAKVFRSGSQETWVKVQFLSLESYAENGSAPEQAVWPVFVKVLKRDLPAKREDLTAEVAALTRTVASVCGRPEENVHVIYEPPGLGRMAFGGRVVQ